MWKDKLKGLFQDVCKEVKEACEEIKEDVKDIDFGEELKKAGEEIKKAGQELKEEFMSEEKSEENTQAVKTVPETFETADAECGLTVPEEDGPRGEFTGLSENTYSYLIPKDPGFTDEGDCHAAEIHQAYGYGETVNYEQDVMMYFSIAPEFDCEIKEDAVKAAYTRYDSAPSRSGLMTVEHPVFTHAYLFDTPKKYRLTYLKQIAEYEILGCELILKKSGGDEVWKAKMIEEFKRFAGSCREV